MDTNPRTTEQQYVICGLVGIRGLVLPIVFGADIILKVLARSMLAAGGRFALEAPVGLIGFVPSHNNVLAFSLPIPNGWIWPVGWGIVAALFVGLVRSARRSTKHQAPGINEIPRTKFQIPTVRHSDVGFCKLFGHWCLVIGHSSRSVAILALILGAISNLLDRTLRGGVTDYLSVTSLFPAFNIADMLIIGGVLGWWVTPRMRVSDHRLPTTDH